LLQGKSLEVYQRMTDSGVEKYGVFKAQLLKRFRLTQGGYRKKFKSTKLNWMRHRSICRTPLALFDSQWCGMSGFKEISIFDLR